MRIKNISEENISEVGFNTKMESHALVVDGDQPLRAIENFPIAKETSQKKASSANWKKYLITLLSIVLLSAAVIYKARMISLERASHLSPLLDFVFN